MLETIYLHAVQVILDLIRISWNWSGKIRLSSMA